MRAEIQQDFRLFVIPANAGIQSVAKKRDTRFPAFARTGMTNGAIFDLKRTKPIRKRYKTLKNWIIAFEGVTNSGGDWRECAGESGILA